MPLRGTTLFVALVSARTENNSSVDNFPFLVVNVVIGDVRVEVNVPNLILSIWPSGRTTSRCFETQPSFRLMALAKESRNVRTRIRVRIIHVVPAM